VRLTPVETNRAKIHQLAHAETVCERASSNVMHQPDSGKGAGIENMLVRRDSLAIRALYKAAV